jgi:uncharacterized protein (TIGR02996 family)
VAREEEHVTETAFLRAAAAQPDDDTLRLVYADWLDEQGGDVFATQAAFVRLQVRRSRLDVFDPDRAALLEEEAKLLQKHKRDWNGRIHHQLHRCRLFGLVDSRRGAIRKWDYHRGMISRVSLPADGLVAHADFVSSLGPVQALELHGHHHWSGAEARALGALARVKVLTLRGYLLLPSSSRVDIWPFHQVTVLDIRSLPYLGNPASSLRAAARAGDLPPVILFRQTAITTLPPRGGFTPQEARQAVHVIDPHNKWDALRLWFADFTGELLDPVRV